MRRLGHDLEHGPIVERVRRRVLGPRPRLPSARGVPRAGVARASDARDDDQRQRRAVARSRAPAHLRAAGRDGRGHRRGRRSAAGHGREHAPAQPARRRVRPRARAAAPRPAGRRRDRGLRAGPSRRRDPLERRVRAAPGGGRGPRLHRDRDREPAEQRRQVRRAGWRRGQRLGPRRRGLGARPRSRARAGRASTPTTCSARSIARRRRRSSPAVRASGSRPPSARWPRSEDGCGHPRETGVAPSSASRCRWRTASVPAFEDGA